MTVELTKEQFKMVGFINLALETQLIVQQINKSMKYKKIILILIILFSLVVVGYLYLESCKRANNTKEIIKAYKDGYEKSDSVENK